MKSSNTPPWLKKRLVTNNNVHEMKAILSKSKVNTVCESSLCPNLNECFSRKRATFLILGDVCTRSCGFCSVKKGRASEVDKGEIINIVTLIQELGLGYVVVTSVTRDDLGDGGASQFISAVKRIKDFFEDIKVEVLVPDFNGSRNAVEDIVGEAPDVFGHNIETIKRLYPYVRQGSDYDRSIGLLKAAKETRSRQITKSSLMVGLGEKEEEVFSAMEDLIKAGCDMLSIGQYLRPREDNVPIDRLVTPSEFKRYNDVGLKMGFKNINAGPFVRSSYLAEDMYNIGRSHHDRSKASAIS